MFTLQQQRGIVRRMEKRMSFLLLFALIPELLTSLIGGLLSLIGAFTGGGTVA